MNLSYRILDCDIFESYMALEGWESFPYLKSVADKDGAMGYIMEDFSYMIFDFTPSDNLLKAICIYKMFGDTLYIHFFEVSKKFRRQGIGQSAIERLLLETGARRIELDAKDSKAARFWESIGLVQSDQQHYIISV